MSRELYKKEQRDFACNSLSHFLTFHLHQKINPLPHPSPQNILSFWGKHTALLRKRKLSRNAVIFRKYSPLEKLSLQYQEGCNFLLKEIFWTSNSGFFPMEIRRYFADKSQISAVIGSCGRNIGNISTNLWLGEFFLQRPNFTHCLFVPLTNGVRASYCKLQILVCSPSIYVPSATRADRESKGENEDP